MSELHFEPPVAPQQAPNLDGVLSLDEQRDILTYRSEVVLARAAATADSIRAHKRDAFLGRLVGNGMLRPQVGRVDGQAKDGFNFSALARCGLEFRSEYVLLDKHIVAPAQRPDAVNAHNLAVQLVLEYNNSLAFPSAMLLPEGVTPVPDTFRLTYAALPASGEAYDPRQMQAIRTIHTNQPITAHTWSPKDMALHAPYRTVEVSSSHGPYKDWQTFLQAEAGKLTQATLDFHESALSAAELRLEAIHLALQNETMHPAT